ncbi:MAG: acyl carrier protein [Phormidesmis sp.]
MTAITTEPVLPKDAAAAAADAAPDSEEVRTWLADYLADLLEVEGDEIDTSLSFDQYGLDSSTAVGITGDLSDWLNQDIDPVLLYDYPTIDALVEHLESDAS